MTKASVLLFTAPQDIHACAVDYVLGNLGAQPVIVNTAGIPNGVPLSVRYRGDKAELHIGDYQGLASDVNSSWNRRFTKSFSLPPFSHPADGTHIRINASASLNGLLSLLDRSFPVNPLYAARIIGNKLHQIQVAAASGFRVPKTLVSNDPDDIESFLAEVGDACVKAHHTQTWRTDTGMLQALTNRVSLKSSIPRQSYQISPHIFQEYITKVAEYRLVMFGQYSAAIRINTSKLDGAAAIDWRSDPTHLDALTPHKLPPKVIEAAKYIMRALGLRFGAFDIAETKEGDYVFLEVNEAGQWLWQEIHCPECRILQPFCEYLIHASEDYEWHEERKSQHLDAELVVSEARASSKYRDLLTQEHPDKDVFHADEREPLSVG